MSTPNNNTASNEVNREVDAEDDDEISIEKVRDRPTRKTVFQGTKYIFPMRNFVAYLENNPNDANCDICHESFRPLEGSPCDSSELDAWIPHRIYKCRTPHLFHHGCISIWFRDHKKQTCPKCRERCYWFEWENIRDKLILDKRALEDLLKEIDPLDEKGNEDRERENWRRILEEELEAILRDISHEFDTIKVPYGNLEGGSDEEYQQEEAIRVRTQVRTRLDDVAVRMNRSLGTTTGGYTCFNS
ncbi:hypothetical protein CC80DRAFT_507679 [Byssothecium circinans]|uniref:RING-type domain-containing protein n=1 Tax=Byssothecium circinans TaxID=147558 RepID=A0A6A5TJN8_9PLEO|nr:hypothetical protein CC80DRAFT_507679 [Byssothecium circinans]